MRRILLAVLSLALARCGGDEGAPWRQLAAKCATPRSGTDPFTNKAYPDQKGSLDDEKKWLRAWTDDTYLWYSEVPALDPAGYPTAIDYFKQLKTQEKTSSGNFKDRFHFWDTTAHWEMLSQSGAEVGYGVTWTVLSLANSLPREFRVAYVEANSPAASIPDAKRGSRIISIDMADMLMATDQASVDKLNAGLGPSQPGEQHTFVLEDYGTTTQHTVVLTAQNLVTNPVPDTHTIDVGVDKVGYLLFNDHLATAEKALVDAITTLKGASVKDLILDIRYNGGGYLDIASQLAYMIAGSGHTSGKTFERPTFNDKHPTIDPVTGQTITPTPFFNTTLGFSLSPGAQLPSLGLSRVFVLTGSGTCSASEAILNGLAGVDVQVIQIGRTTCGKPYGFYPADNCGITYFSIQIKGANAKGFGDYADGFEPGAATTGSLAGCKVADDFTHALGDAAEARLATALAYRGSPSCPTPTSRNLLMSGESGGEGVVLKSIWRQNRIFRR